MAHLRLLLVFAAIAALGYAAYRRGGIPISFNPAAPTAEPTLGFMVRQGRHLHHPHRHPSGTLGAQLSSRWRSNRELRMTPAASATMLAAIPAGSNALEIPSASSASPTPSGPKSLFPKNFEGCWQATVTQPESWTFGRGPVVKGISPSTYMLCFHNAGPNGNVTFSTTAEYPVVSDWVVSNVGVENGHTDVLFSGDNFVVLRTKSSTPLHMKILGVFPGPTGIITSRTDFHCTHLDGDKMLVEASTEQRCINAHTIDCDGDVWIKESWHAEFDRVSG